MNGFLMGIGLAALLIFTLIIMLSIECDSKTLAVVLTILAVIILGYLTNEYYNKDIDKPTALDVYRDNTTLQITYQDSIPIDSVVVFKTIKNK